MLFIVEVEKKINIFFLKNYYKSYYNIIIVISLL